MFDLYKYQWSSDDDELMEGPTPTDSDTEEEEEDTAGGDFLKNIELGSILEQVKNMPDDQNTREEYQNYLEDVADLVRFLKRVIWRNTKVSKLGLLNREKQHSKEEQHQQVKTTASSTIQH